VSSEADGQDEVDWHDWHRAYDDPASALSRRLRLVQQEIGAWLDARPEPELRVVSLCAGQGRDLLDVLASRPDAGRVRALLVEADERNAALARGRAARLPEATVDVLQADAGVLGAYAGWVPADLVLLAGVLGNIPDGDVEATVRALPQLCAPGGAVVWTRTRAAPDLTPAVRGWLAETGFTERAFHAPGDALFTVGVSTFEGTPQPLDVRRRIFRFVD
jgi:hypothetical protein